MSTVGRKKIRALILFTVVEMLLLGVVFGFLSNKTALIPAIVCTGVFFCLMDVATIVGQEIFLRERAKRMIAYYMLSFLCRGLLSVAALVGFYFAFPLLDSVVAFFVQFLFFYVCSLSVTTIQMIRGEKASKKEICG